MSVVKSEFDEALPALRQKDDNDSDYAANDIVAESHSYQGMVLKSVLGPDEGFISGKQPDIDIVHVVGIGTEDELLDASSIILPNITSKRRTFTFTVDIASLLTGNLSMAAIELQAEQLLGGISYFRKFEANKNPWGRAIAFVAYDLGALVLKKAISTAGIYRDRWPDVFSHAAQFLFYGCFQRARGLQLLTSKLSEFLYSNAKEPWKKHLSPTSISSVARSSLETTGMFISSRVTLCSRVTSLYANGGVKAKIHPVFDYFTATLGLPVELPIEEQDEGQFPNLADKFCFQVETWVPHQSWAPFEQMLVSLATPHRQSALKSSIGAHPILERSAHQTWLKSRGTSILSIEGGDSKTRRDAAEHVFQSWQAKQIEKGEYGTKNFSFTFSASDQLRDSIDDMIISLLLQEVPRYYSSGSETDEYRLMKNQFHIQRAWTQQDLLLMFKQQSYRFLGTGTLILLQDIEFCEKNGLAAFWDILKGQGSPSEFPFKIVITQPRSDGLLQALTIEQYIIPDAGRSAQTADAADYVDSKVYDLCPNGHGESQVRKSLLALGSVDTYTADQIISFARRRTGWPDEPTLENLSAMCSILKATSRSSSPSTVLDLSLRVDPDQDGLRWILGWLLCAFRPLTWHELACIYYYGKHSEPREPSLMDIQTAKLAIENHLRGIADFSHDQVTIRGDVVVLLKPGPDFFWTDVKVSAPRMIMDFLLRYLPIWETGGRFENIYQQYQQVCKNSQGGLTAPLISDGEDPLFYAVQFFPSHLSAAQDCLEGISHDLVIPTGLFMSWTKVFWAMSNPFSRPREHLGSALEALLDISDLRPDFRDVLEELKSHTLLAAASKSDDERFVNSVLVKAFDRAVRLGEEDKAITLAKQMSSTIYRNNEPGAGSSIATQDWALNSSEGSVTTTESFNITFTRPTFQRALWRAIWLNMIQLVNFLLEGGTSPSAPDVDSWSFPLHLAARLGHIDILRDLLSHGADIKPNTETNILRAAASVGQLDTAKFLAAEYSSLLEDSAVPPFYSACYWGRLGVVEALLALGADPDEPYEPDPKVKWNPLLVATREGHLGIMEALLKRIRDPNRCGTSAEVNPLYLAAVDAGNSDAVRLLLKYGLDPNDELINPPLVLEILRSDNPDEDRLEILDMLVANEPRAQIDLAESPTGVTPLMCAAAKGKLSLAKWLLDHNSNVNAADENGMTALSCAVNFNHVELVRAILPYKPRLDIKTTSGETLNQIAVGKEEILQILLNLEPPLDVELTNDDGLTALGCAVAQRLPQAVKLLLSRNANIHHRDNSGYTVILDAAVVLQDPEILRILAEGGANLQDATPNGHSVLHLATKSGEELLRMLLQFRKRINLEQRDSLGRTALHHGLIYHASEESIQSLIRAGANVNAQDKEGLTPIYCAVYFESLPNLKLLLAEPECDPNLCSKHYGPPLICACMNLLPDFVQLLLDKGADVDAQWHNNTRYSPLIATLTRPIPRDGTRDEIVDKIVRMLIEHGAHVRHETAFTHGGAICNPLLAACTSASVTMIHYLVDSGASIQDVGPLRNHPIHFAAINGIRNLEAVSQFYEADHGDLLLVTDVAGKTALHWAAQYSHAETLKFILDKVAPFDKKWRRKILNDADVDGWTPLAWATRPETDSWGWNSESESHDIRKTVQYLLDEGADPSAQFTIGQGGDAETFTPLTMARLCNLPEAAISAIRDASACNGGTEDTASLLEKRYTRWEGICDICLSTVYGHAYRCETCTNFDACKKCYGRINIYHGHLKTADGEPHAFKLNTECDKEFEDPPELEQMGEDANGAGENGSQARLEAPEDLGEIDGLGLSELDDSDMDSE